MTRLRAERRGVCSAPTGVRTIRSALPASRAALAYAKDSVIAE